ncbi:MAG TPA: hypothetical protein PKW35_25030 [Nannocystaceae bacterium]|nr:hypothetical protein [Nannocystaceae bacterium]
MPMLRFVAPLLVCATLAGASGCSDARCDPNPVGEAWKPYESLLPDAAVVCGPNRKSAAKPSDVVDDYPPTHVFVFYEEKNPAGALDATLKKFEAAGWQLAKMDIIGEGSSGIYDATVTKDGAEIRISVNRNDWGTQGSFDLKAAEPASP